MTSARPGGVPLRAGVLLTGLGGAAGALLRWALSQALPLPEAFPWTTLTINVGGCAALAGLPLLARVHRRPWLPLLLGPGFLGGFTAMSAASLETFELAETGHPVAAAGYAIGTLLAAVTVVALVDRWTSARAGTGVRLEGEL